MTTAFAVAGSPAHLIRFEDTLRPDAAAAMARLRQQGFAPELLSGDPLDARTDPDWTVTLPNHTGMLTGRLVEGGMADLCLFDAGARWTVEPRALRSQGKHSPFAGMELPGRVRTTLVAGHVAYEAA